MIKRPTEEEVELGRVQDKIDQEVHASIETKKLDAQRELAKLKFSVSQRQKNWLVIAKTPIHITILWLIFWLTIFNKRVPTVLEELLRK